MNNLNLEIKDFGVINHANIELNKIKIGRASCRERV